MCPTIALLLLLTAACGGGDSAADAAPPGDGPDAGPPRPRLGFVDVVEDLRFFSMEPMEYRQSQVFAQFFEEPPTGFHHQTLASGACVLREYTPGFCDAPCGGICVDGECRPFPVGVSAGRLDLAGLTTDVSIQPQDGYYYSDRVLPADLFGDDAHVVATLAGDVLPAMTLEAVAVSPLAADIPHTGIHLAPGEDHVLTWTPDGGGRIRVTLNANNQGHGLPYLAIIECAADDAAGQLTIPAALIDAFPETFAWQACAGADCPPSTIRRYRRGTFAIGAAEVELTVASQTSFGVDHPLE